MTVKVKTKDKNEAILMMKSKDMALMLFRFKGFLRRAINKQDKPYDEVWDRLIELEHEYDVVGVDELIE